MDWNRIKPGRAVGNAGALNLGSTTVEGMAMKEKLQALIEKKILEWQGEGIYETIYALSLYVYNEEDDPGRPVAVLGYNTGEQAERSASLASDQQEARWNYAFWLQNEELCWGRGDTAGEVRRWIAGLGTEAGEEEIAGAFRELLIQVVKDLHATGLLKNHARTELPILIHGLEYDRETARQNLEANGETLDRDFLAFCGGKQDGSNIDWDAVLSEPVIWRRKENPIPKKFNCGEIRADMRHVMAFILIIIFVMSTLGMYGIIRAGSGAAPDMEENGSVASLVSEEDASENMGTEEMPPVSDSWEENESGIEPAQAQEPGQEQEDIMAAAEEKSARQWQIFIHPDVPEPLVEVLEQYEKVMRADFDLDDFYGKEWKELGIEGRYVYDEVYVKWRYASEDDWDVSICYSLEDLTGDGIPELVMGCGYYHDEAVRYYPIIVYCIGKNGDIQFIETTPYYDMTFYEGGIIEFVSAGINYTINYYQYSQEEQDWLCVEALGAQWDNENGVDVNPYRQITPDGEYEEQERLSVEEFQKIMEQYTQKEVELKWYPLCRPDWHILVSSGQDYDLYLEGISTDLWLAEKDVRQLYFSIYDKKGGRVQELVEASPYLPYMPEVYYAENTNIDWDEGWGHHAGNFYFQDMNFDGKEDLVLLWMNINHSYWKVYLWREEEGVFREELPVNMSDGDGNVWNRRPAMAEEGADGVFGYYNVVEEKKYIDEYIKDGYNQTTIYRMRYDEEWGYLCVGALEVYYEDDGAERYRECFFEDGGFVNITEIISREEVSGLWSDFWEHAIGN